MGGSLEKGVVISPAGLELRYGPSHDLELTNTDTLLYQDYIDLQLRRDHQREIYGTVEVTPYEFIPVSYYDYEKDHRHVARNGQVIDIVKEAYSTADPTSDFVVIETGAGVGRFGERLTTRMRELRESSPDSPRFIYYPSDISNAAIKSMQEKGLLPARVSATHLPYARNSADIIYGGEIIEHLSFPMFIQFLSEAKRVLKDTGILIITTPNYNSLPAREEKKAGIIPYNFDEQRNSWASEHVLPFTRQSYQEILSRFGFNIASVSTNNITWKVENGVPTDFTIYENASDVPDSEKGDTLIISSTKM